MKKILIADDDLEMRIYMRTVIETAGYEAMVAENGPQALEMALANNPDLAFLDVMMPAIEDGLETFRGFRGNEKLKDIPLVMVSALAKKNFFHSLGMLAPGEKSSIREPDAYVEKPPEAEDLLRICKEQLDG